jgi:SAM-dependent methyltransferase
MESPPIPYAEIAASLSAHLAEFRRIPLAEVHERLEGARSERNRLWSEAAPRTEDEREALYRSLGELDLFKYAQWHRQDQEKQELHDEMVALARERSLSVLDCGGGIGDTTLVFAANGVEVTYVDFPGVCSEFARFRWEKFGCAERVHALDPDAFWARAELRVGMIASIDVLEHLENPVRHAHRYHELLSPGGVLFVTAHFRHNAHNPDHLPANDGLHRIFGGERKTARRCVLSNLGFKRKAWYRYVKP